MNDVLEQLKAEYEELPAEEVAAIEAEVIEEAPAEEAPAEEVPAEENDAPGYIDNLDDWVAAGKDPDDFKGKNAYKAEYDRIQEVRELKANQKEMSETLRATVEAIAERESKSEARHRQELETALNQAKEDGDTDAALDAADQLHELDRAPKPQGKQDHPVISEFLSSNAALADSEIKSEFARIYNGKLKADGVSPTEELSPQALKGYLAASMNSVKTLYPDKFVSPKKARQAAPKAPTRPANKTVNIEQALRDYKVDGVSSNNSNAALDMYLSFKKTNPKMAEQFGKNILGIK